MTGNTDIGGTAPQAVTAQDIARVIAPDAFRDGDIQGLRARSRERCLRIAQRLQSEFIVTRRATAPTADQRDSIVEQLLVHYGLHHLDTMDRDYARLAIAHALAIGLDASREQVPQ